MPATEKQATRKKSRSSRRGEDEVGNDVEVTELSKEKKRKEELEQMKAKMEAAEMIEGQKSREV